MGPGGPRGLQILRSGASRVRGGFDSHAFPPFVLGVAVVALLATAPAGARAVAAPAVAAVDTLRDGLVADSLTTTVAVDSLSSARDTTARGFSVGPGGIVRAPSPAGGAGAERRAFRPRPRGLLGEPRFVLMRSLVVPGWGQAYNHKWFKAGLVAAGEGWLASRLIAGRNALDRYEAEVRAARAARDQEREIAAVDAYNHELDRFTANSWLLGGVVLYAITDAYVDAHFRDFDLEFKYDPALPGGVPPSSHARLSLRWEF